MPYRLNADPILRCNLVRWWGRFSAPEVLDYYAGFAALPSAQRRWPSLHDARWWDLAVPMSEIRIAGEQTAPAGLYEAPRRVAIVVETDLAFGMMRVLAALRERPDMDLDVFREVRAAMDWIGLPAEARDPFAGA